MLKDLVAHIVKNLVEKPEAVTVSEIVTDDKKVIQVHVSAQDLARVIGSEGRTFRALRTIVNLVSDPLIKQDIVVDIAE